MRKKIISVVCFLLAVFVSHGIAADSAPFFFLQLSDPQFGFMDNNKSISAETEAMNKAVTAINQLKPPFVLQDILDHIAYDKEYYMPERGRGMHY